MLRDVGALRLKEAAEELGSRAITAHRLLAMLMYRGFAVPKTSSVSTTRPGNGIGPHSTGGPES